MLSHDGSLLTAASIAALGALAHFRLPATSVQGEQVTVFTAAEREPVPLTLLHWPLCVSMWFFAGKGREMVLLDATLREEQVCNGEIVVTANAQGEICQVKKLGGPPADALLLLQCVDTAVKVVKEHLARKLREALDKDTQARDKGGVMTAALSAENER